MSIKKHYNRIRYINHMIKNRATGDLGSFARKNNLSKSALSEIINEMKELGFPIKFDRIKKTYYYEENGDMSKWLFIKYGEPLEVQQKVEIGKLEDLCFSEKAVYIPCKKE